ncbi:galactose-1-epimerase [Lonsdalea quercina]|uniref:galactose-1-epimerase n=1 Tax=Lonsdalea quercina TaxID=71657 RepID=UPI0039761A08
MHSEASSTLAPDGQPFQLNLLRNASGMCVTVMDWGATWTSCLLPLSPDETREVLLGCAPEHYPHQSAYMGASVGRYANRIANAALDNEGHHIPLAANSGKHQLHGGPVGFSARRWRIVQHSENAITYQLHSPAGDQGFPGHLTVEAHYHLTDDNRLTIAYRAEVDRACPVCLTNHAYFNLDGTFEDVRRHQLQLFADHFLPTDAEGIPFGKLKPVADSSMDFRLPKTLLQDFLTDDDQRAVGGYDHAFSLRQDAPSPHPAAVLWSSDKRARLDVSTSAPALQVYTGNALEGTPDRNGGTYPNYAGIALESEFLPDSPHHPEWPQPDCWLNPGETYLSLTAYRFFFEDAPNVV